MPKLSSSRALVPSAARVQTTALVPTTASASAAESGVAARIGAAILHFVVDVPVSAHQASPAPAAAARRVAKAAAARAASAAGTLALPPGPLGWLTILPEMLAVWRVQAQMVADIAALYGREGRLSEEQMLYCLFKHAASQAVRDLVVRVGQRAVITTVTAGALQSVAQRIGMTMTQRVVAKSASRWLPVVGALGVAAYAYYDTSQVAKAAIELFEHGGDTAD